jgi:hypothetical protein
VRTGTVSTPSEYEVNASDVLRDFLSDDRRKYPPSVAVAFLAASWRLIYEIPLGIVGVILGLGFAAAIIERRSTPNPKGKRYVMRGYGKSGPNVTHVHPRQQKQGKRIVYIPGVGYRHVQSKPKRKT